MGPSGASRSLVLVDGVPANDPFFGGWVYFRALPRLGLGRVEVVPGGGSTLYGSSALGGPEGALYVLTDEKNGKLLKVTPANK